MIQDIPKLIRSTLTPHEFPLHCSERLLRQILKNRFTQNP